MPLIGLIKNSIIYTEKGGGGEYTRSTQRDHRDNITGQRRKKTAYIYPRAHARSGEIHEITGRRSGGVECFSAFRIKPGDCALASLHKESSNAPHFRYIAAAGGKKRKESRAAAAAAAHAIEFVRRVRDMVPFLILK